MKIFARISRHSNRNSEHLPLIHYSETLQTITTEFTQKVLIFLDVTSCSLIAAKNLEGPPAPIFRVEVLILKMVQPSHPKGWYLSVKLKEVDLKTHGYYWTEFISERKPTGTWGSNQFLPWKMSKLAVGPTRLPTQWIPGHLHGDKAPECEVDHSLSSSAEVKNEWNHTSVYF